jgi:hypothetical protein
VRDILGGQLAVQQVRREEVPLPPGQVPGQHVPVFGQVDQPGLGPATQQRVAVLAAQRRAGDDGRLARRDLLVHPGSDGVQPRPAVGVGERLAPVHLGDRHGGMERVGVRERPAQPRRQPRADRGLAAAGRPGDDDDHIAGLYRRGQR